MYNYPNMSLLLHEKFANMLCYDEIKCFSMQRRIFKKLIWKKLIKNPLILTFSEKAVAKTKGKRNKEASPKIAAQMRTIYVTA
jgi:hypothetical protein